MSTNTYAVVLAAGLSRRFDGTKLIQDFGGAPLVLHAVRLASEACPGRVVLVSGHDADLIEEHTRDLGARVVFNPGFADGIGSSIAAGVSAVADQADHVLILLGDQPLIPLSHLQNLLALSTGNPAHIITSEFRDVLGPPVIFPQSFFPVLAELKRDQGARKIIASNPESVLSAACPAAEWDVDTLDDLQALRERLNNNKSDPKPMTTSYFVRYECDDGLTEQFVEHYRSRHVPILLQFPGILSVSLHLPTEFADAHPINPGKTSLMAQMVFDSTEALEAALNSPQRDLARTDFHEHLDFDGEAFHQAMITTEFMRGQ